MSFVPLPPRKLQKLPPRNIQERHKEVVTLASMAEMPSKRQARKLTKTPPRAWGTFTPLSGASDRPIFPSKRNRERSGSSSSLGGKTSLDQSASKPASKTSGDSSISSVSIRGEKKMIEASNRLVRASKTMRRVLMMKKKPSKAGHIPQFTQSQLILAVVEKPIMSEGLKALRQAQVKIIKEVLADFDHHSALLNRTINQEPISQSSVRQSSEAAKELRLIEPAGRKLKLFLRLIRLEGEMDKNAISFQDQTCSAPAFEELITARKRLESKVEKAEADFDNVYDELASRDRDELEELIWTIFDKYGDLVFDDWPLTWYPWDMKPEITGIYQ
jgi:hypothetical protein